MEKGRSLLRWSEILVAVVMVSFIMSSPAVFGVKTQLQDAPEIRADIIRIDSMNVFGKLERPSVTFLHQKHTEALEKKNKDSEAKAITAMVDSKIEEGYITDDVREHAIYLFTNEPKIAADLFKNKKVPINVTQAGVDPNAEKEPEFSALTEMEQGTVHCMTAMDRGLDQKDAIKMVVSQRPN